MEEPPTLTPTTTTTTPVPSPRALQDPNTTFVQADTTSFKQVVQMLTGSPDTAAAAARPHPIPPKPSFRLYERRRNSLIKNNHLNILHPYTHRPDVILSPSALNFPSLALSPVTPLLVDPFHRSTASAAAAAAAAEVEEEKAIAEKGFYLIPSPRSGAGSGGSEPPPRLLPLFPLTSPKSNNGSAGG